MKIAKLGLKLIGVHAIMSLIEFVMLMPLSNLRPNNQFYQWVLGIIMILLFWLIIASVTNKVGMQELKRGIFWWPKGFIAGLIASIPPAFLYILAIITKGDPNYADVILRIWLSPYGIIYTSFEEKMPYIAIVPILLLSIITGLGYLDGIRKRRKNLEIIKESLSKKAEKSKINRD